VSATALSRPEARALQLHAAGENLRRISKTTKLTVGEIRDTFASAGVKVEGNEPAVSVWEASEEDRKRRFLSKAAKAARAQRIANAKQDGTFYRVSGTVNASLGFKTDETKAAEVAITLHQPSWKVIAAEVCRKHGITVPMLLSKRRQTPIVAARHEFFWRCRNETSMSYPQIGEKCGGRDHSTVIVGIRAHEKRMREAANG
jgi:hypothetical protein